MLTRDDKLKTKRPEFPGILSYSYKCKILVITGSLQVTRNRVAVQDVGLARLQVVDVND